MKKFICILVLTLILSGCADSTNFDNQATDPSGQYNPDIGSNNYSIYYHKANIDGNGKNEPAVEAWDGNYAYVQIRSDNPVLEEKANEVLYESQVSWVYGAAENPEQEIPQIRCHSGRYLSILMELHYFSPKRVWSFTEGVTIDMITGERVFLNDIIDVNDDFIADLKKYKGILWTSGEGREWKIPFTEDSEGFQKWLSEMPDEKLLAMLNDCSKEIEEYNYDESIGELLGKGTFFLENGTLVLIFKTYSGDESRIALDIGQIEPYLKVPKW